MDQFVVGAALGGRVAESVAVCIKALGAGVDVGLFAGFVDGEFHFV